MKKWLDHSTLDELVRKSLFKEIHLSEYLTLEIIQSFKDLGKKERRQQTPNCGMSGIWGCVSSRRKVRVTGAE